MIRRCVFMGSCIVVGVFLTFAFYQVVAGAVCTRVTLQPGFLFGCGMTFVLIAAMALFSRSRRLGQS